MTEYRVCNTSDLRVLSSRSGKHGSDLSPALSAALDPDGTHVLRLALYGHNMDAQNTVLSHRIKVLAKVVGTDEPVEATLDMRDSDWKRLQAYEPEATS